MTTLLSIILYVIIAAIAGIISTICAKNEWFWFLERDDFMVIGCISLFWPYIILLIALFGTFNCIGYTFNKLYELVEDKFTK
jgi:H+/Cl- antiporter ClcA